MSDTPRPPERAPSDPEGDEKDKPNGADQPFRFDDPYWDDAFATFYDPAMRVCSVYGCS